MNALQLFADGFHTRTFVATFFKRSEIFVESKSRDTIPRRHYATTSP